MSETIPTVLDDPLVAALAKFGERYDAERVHPADSIALLADAGLLRRFAPVESGAKHLPTPTHGTRRCSTRCVASVAAI